MASYTVYKITNTCNGKVYVGVTSKSIEQRWKSHVLSSRKNRLALGSAIRKYGENNFIVEAIEECESKKHMLAQEKFWIKELNSYTNSGHGYNMTLGGEGLIGYKYSEEAKRAMAEKRKGVLNHNFGKRWGRVSHPLDFLEMMSQKHTGQGNPMHGRNHSESAKQKIGKVSKRKVTQFDLEGNKLMEFDSMKSAAYFVGCYPQEISRACRFPKTRTAAGHKWQYALEGN